MLDVGETAEAAAGQGGPARETLDRLWTLTVLHHHVLVPAVSLLCFSSMIIH